MATCAELAQKVQTLHSELLHVTNDQARQAILDKLDEVEQEELQQGCFESIFRTFNGTVTLCSDSSFLPGTQSTTIKASLGILTHTGVATLGFSPLPPFPNGITEVKVGQARGITTSPLVRWI